MKEDDSLAIGNRIVAVAPVFSCAKKQMTQKKGKEAKGVFTTSPPALTKTTPNNSKHRGASVSWPPATQEGRDFKRDRETWLFLLSNTHQKQSPC